MNKIDKLIATVRQLREEGAMGGGMTTGSSGSVAGFSALSPAVGPTAGTTYPMGQIQKRKKIIGLGKGSRNRWKKPQP